MNKPVLNYVVDWVSLVTLAALASTGMLMGYALPPGSRGATVLGLTRHDWGEVHLWIAWGFLALVVLHLILHAAWIKALTLGKATGGSRLLRGAVAAGAALMLVALVAVGALAPGRAANDTDRNIQGRRGAASVHDDDHGGSERLHRGRRW